MTTKVLISGGCGFLGQLLAKAILAPEKKGRLGGKVITKLTLADHVVGELSPELQQDPRVEVQAVNIAAPGAWDTLVDEPGMSVFHLAAIMSGQGETDFDLCMDVNLRGFMALLERSRQVGAHGEPVKITITSTGAVFGPLPLVTDETKSSPMTTYGTTKACSELLLNDYTRKGFVDGRGARLPTVLVRAGVPNGASTGVYSGVVREPLNGIDVVLPVSDTLQHAVGAYSTIIGGIVGLHEAPLSLLEEKLGQDRTVNIPSFSVTLRELGAAMKRVVAEDKFMPESSVGQIDASQPDERLNGIVSSMMSSTDSSRALSIGLPDNPPLEQVIREYVADFWTPTMIVAKL